MEDIRVRECHVKHNKMNLSVILLQITVTVAVTEFIIHDAHPHPVIR